jgi:hypothetical protein
VEQDLALSKGGVMSGINIRRVIIGGLVAGLVASVLDFIITSYFLADELAAMVARLNLNAAAMESSVWVFVIVDFVWGLLLVFTYAAVRPRFGPGPKTAVISGIVLWIAISLLEAQIGAMGITTLALYLKGALLYLVSAVAASLVGAALYKEDPGLARASG